MLLVDVSPASAQLPQISCTPRNQLNWCVSYINFRAQAGLGNPTRLLLSLNSPRSDYFRVELVYYPGLPGQRGDVVFADNGYTTVIGAGQVIRSPDFATLLPGTYCARSYLPALGYYFDQHCVTTDGRIVPGNVGTVPPRAYPF